MAYWDYKVQKIIGFLDEVYPGYPDWILRDCGCSNGLHAQ